MKSFAHLQITYRRVLSFDNFVNTGRKIVTSYLIIRHFLFGKKVNICQVYFLSFFNKTMIMFIFFFLHPYTLIYTLKKSYTNCTAYNCAHESTNTKLESTISFCRLSQ